MSDGGFVTPWSPYRKLHFCERIFPLVHMILEDIYKIISHSTFEAWKRFSTGLNYLHDFTGPGAYLISFELWKKTHLNPNQKEWRVLLLKKYCEMSSRIVTEIRRYECGMTMRAQCIQRSKVVLKMTFSDIVFNWNYGNYRMHCVQIVLIPNLGRGNRGRRHFSLSFEDGRIIMLS